MTGKSEDSSMASETADNARKPWAVVQDLTPFGIRVECRHFEGTCDVCGQAVSFDYDPTSGIIDVAVEDARVYTWVRHLDGPQPGCDRYSSRVYLTTLQNAPSSSLADSGE